MSKDKAFLWIIGGLFCFMTFFGLGAIVLSIIQDPSDQVSLRIVGAIGSMFSSCVGLVLGYLVGRNGKSNGRT